MPRPAPLERTAPAPGGDAADDDRLVAAARLDARAFAPLYRRYADPVYRYCWRRLGAKEAAEDATSQIFTQALAALPRYRPAGAFRAWLFAIAHNVVVSTARQPVALALPPDHDRPEPTPGPEELALAAEAGETVRALLARLPEEQRRLLELRLAGLNDAEIARVLDRGHGAIRMAQHRATLRLQALLLVADTPAEADDARR